MNENKANFAKIGFFVLTGVALILLVIGIAGARVFNKRVVLAETYFAESVTGLDLGSPVKYRGVPVGEVKRIGFAYSEYGTASGASLTANDARLVLVVMALEPAKFGLLQAQDSDAILNQLIEQGLRVKLASAGVTGLSFLELDYFRPEAGEMGIESLAWRPHHPYIPASTSMMFTLKKAVDDVVVKLSNVDIQGLSDELLATFHLFKGKLNDADVASLSKEGTALLAELRETNQALKKLASSPELARLPADLSATVGSVRRAAEGVEQQIQPIAQSLQALTARANNLVEGVNELMTNNSSRVEQTVAALNQAAQTLSRTALSQQGSLADLLQNLRSASTGLERIVNDLSANPAALLFGQPPEPLPETKGKGRQ
jgi:ABC-type transporter Mla subunit MlaD